MARRRDSDSRSEALVSIHAGDARHLPLPDSSVDLIVTSPPYWKKRDYGHADQIGQEPTAQDYVEALLQCLKEWRRVLRPTGSVFLNVGDTYYKRGLAGIPGLLEVGASEAGWLIRNRIIWAKRMGVPSPVRNRLVNRHEFIYHLTGQGDYYYDLQGYSEATGKSANPGDVWDIALKPSRTEHLAPFPPELVERAILLACPEAVCGECGQPRRRIVRRTTDLDESRPQARRAVELAKEHGLTKEHIAAIQATGISDAGKAMRVQSGTGRNSAEVQRLASEAKAVLKGYFREFTFAKRVTAGFTTCKCHAGFIPGVVLDPFSGCGTAMRVAASMHRNGIGVDLTPVTTELDEDSPPPAPSDTMPGRAKRAVGSTSKAKVDRSRPDSASRRPATPTTGKPSKRALGGRKRK